MPDEPTERIDLCSSTSSEVAGNPDVGQVGRTGHPMSTGETSEDQVGETRDNPVDLAALALLPELAEKIK